ncbi:PREDICTED: uncharacterized protein LOC101808387 [Ficedula albicollis]|uniref:uncharacterized protein LOC101808387 n=1 Tax=Ficedula albicollis TaxID=59894 RepID=UPI000359FF42|nr:PREDICTED: uncharacterized protein LOC101808387 [Ficedula albicollis]
MGNPTTLQEVFSRIVQDATSDHFSVLGTLLTSFGTQVPMHPSRLHQHKIRPTQLQVGVIESARGYSQGLACTSSNSSLLKPRGLTQAFFGLVQLTARTCGQHAAAGPTGTPICWYRCVLTADPTLSPLADGRDVAGCTGMWRAASAGSCSRFQERSVPCLLQAVPHLLIPSELKIFPQKASPSSQQPFMVETPARPMEELPPALTPGWLQQTVLGEILRNGE